MNDVLVTGCRGFIGSKLTQMLIKKGYMVWGLDSFYYDKKPDMFLAKDIRDVVEKDIKGRECILHLAGLSGDNTANIIPKNAYSINYEGTVKLAKLAKKCKVERFIFASTCSVYGWQPNGVINELSPVDPNGHYSKSKYMAEKEILKLNDKKFTVTSLRPATSYGSSDNLRCDLVVNNLIAQACTQDIVEVTSDGKPLRPVIHNEDFSAGFIACMEAPKELVEKQIFNLGRTIDNYSVRDMANKVCNIAHKKYKCTNTHPETQRNYKVSFNKIETILCDYYKPKYDLNNGIKVTYKWMKPLIKKGEFNTIYNRKYIINKLIKDRNIDSTYHWRL